MSYDEVMIARGFLGEFWAIMHPDRILETIGYSPDDIEMLLGCVDNAVNDADQELIRAGCLYPQ